MHTHTHTHTPHTSTRKRLRCTQQACASKQTQPRPGAQLDVPRLGQGRLGHAAFDDVRRFQLERRDAATDAKVAAHGFAGAAVVAHAPSAMRTSIHTQRYSQRHYRLQQHKVMTSAPDMRARNGPTNTNNKNRRKQPRAQPVRGRRERRLGGVPAHSGGCEGRAGSGVGADRRRSGHVAALHAAAARWAAQLRLRLRPAVARDVATTGRNAQRLGGGGAAVRCGACSSHWRDGADDTQPPSGTTG